MCGIFISSIKDTFIELGASNSNRGSYSYSITDCALGGGINSIHQGLGVLDETKIPGEFGILIGHVQAPTSSDGFNPENIHPAKYENSYLWHNGMILPPGMDVLKTSLNKELNWDTKLLVEYIEKGNDLSDIEGSFACVLLNEKGLFIFRNQLSPLFYRGLNFSSVPFEGSKMIPPGVIYKITNNGIVETEKTFSTKNNPYFFG